jgi:hypothetical protein
MTQKLKSPGEFVGSPGLLLHLLPVVSGCPIGEWRAYNNDATYYDDVNDHDHKQADGSKSRVGDDHTVQRSLLKAIGHN